jgi:hypothetical protein
MRHFYLVVYSIIYIAPGLQEAAAKRFDEAVQLRHNEDVLDEKIHSKSEKQGEHKLIIVFVRL